MKFKIQKSKFIILATFFLLLSSYVYAQDSVKVTDMPVVTAPDGTEVFYVAKNDSDKQMTWATMASAMQDTIANTTGDVTFSGSPLVSAIGTGKVTTTEILDETITSADILDGTIDNADLGGNSVTSAKIAPLTIVADDISTGGVTTTQILNETITGSDVQNGSLTGAEITDNSLTANDISTGGVTTTEILNETITSADILNNTITSADISNNTITSADISSETITSENILDEAIAGDDIGSQEVALSHLTAATINYIDAAGGGTITNQPDDITIENVTDTTLGVKQSWLDGQFEPGAVLNDVLLWDGSKYANASTSAFKDTLLDLYYYLSFVRVDQIEDISFDFLQTAITLDSMRCATYDSTFAVNIYYGTTNHLGGDKIFGSDQTIATQSPADTTITISEIISADNYLRIYIDPTGNTGEFYDVKIYYHY